MFGSDPMGYTMEQLVKALAAETMNEITLDEAEVEEEPTGPGMWEVIAETAINEINCLFENSPIHPHGYHADEVVYTMKPLLEPYSVYPAAHKFLSAVEKVATEKFGSDPRPYVNLVVRIFDNDSAREWRNQWAFR